MLKHFEKELIKQSNTHPDQALKEFYSASLSFLKVNKEFKNLHKDLLKKRAEMPPKHYVNLYYRAFQYDQLFKKNNKEIYNYTRKEWAIELNSLMQESDALSVFTHLIETESTQTTIYQRYIGPKAVLRAVYSNSPIIVADIGCGLNLGLPGIELNYPFLDIRDETPGEFVTQEATSELNITDGISLDINNPKLKRKWALACGFYPKELANLPETARLCDYLWKKTKTSFVKGSILDLSKIWTRRKLPKCDAVIASTVLYQISDKDRESALAEIWEILTPGGILIINDFLAVNHKILWNVEWFGNKGKTSSYTTVVLQKEDKAFSSPYEFIKWDNGRCKVAYSGKDFKKVLEL